MASPQVAQIQTAIAATITAYQSVISSTGSANIAFDIMSSGLGTKLINTSITLFLFFIPLGMSSTFLVSVSYQSYRRKLAAYSNSISDQSALAYLPDQINDPVKNGTKIWLKTALARTLGYSVANLQDSTVYVNIGKCNVDRTNMDPLM